jgi:HlyD family secretion protein
LSVTPTAPDEIVHAGKYTGAASAFSYARRMSQSSSRRRYVRSALLLLIALVGVAFWLLQARGPRLAVVQLSTQPLEQRVVASGRVSTVSRAQIGSEMGGVVLERLVNEGDRVVPGQVLLIMRDDDLEANLAQARASLAALEQSRRPQAQASLREAEARTNQTLREYERRQALGQQQLVARESVEQARQAWISAQAARDQARSVLQAVSRDGAETRQETARVAAAQAALDKTQVRATVAGTVLTRAVEPGDTVQPGSVLLEIACDGPTELRVPVDEKNLGVLAVGQSAQAVADAWPDRPFPATVRWIAPSVDSSRGSVEVRLDLEPVPDFLRQDMTISVNILSARKEQALVLPNTALITDANGGNQASVWRVDDGRLLRTQVTVGLRGTSNSEVVAGLQAGQLVVADARADLAEGQRVRPDEQTLPAGDLPARAD